MASQTINDRFLAAKHSIAGQGLAKSVCKATTEELIGPKKKHLDYLVHCTNEPNVSIPQLANLLIERSQSANWIVVYKALITTHHIMSYGNERFTQYMASSNSTFHLSNFLDKSGLQGMINIRTGYDMCPFIRRYSVYLNEKAMSYRTVAFDFCKVKKNKDGIIRTMHPDKLLKTLPVLQCQLDRLLEFDCSPNDLSNGVINMSFMLLFRDLIRLFACYNNGIINLLEKYFDMNKKQCKEALDIYKTFLIRMDKVGEFLKVAENVGVNNNDIPDLTKAPSSLLEALNQHLDSMDGKKSANSNTNTPSQSASNKKNIRSAVSALSSTSSSFGTLVESGRLDSTTTTIDDTLKQQALAEEEAAMHQFKTKFSPTSTTNTSNPFHNGNTNGNNVTTQQQQQQSLDLFGAASMTQSSSHSVQYNNASKASDDLLQLENPFMQNQPQQQTQPFQTQQFSQQQTQQFQTQQFQPQQQQTQQFQQQQQQQPHISYYTQTQQPQQQQYNEVSTVVLNPWTNGNGYNNTSPLINNSTFVSDSNFQSVFGNNTQPSSKFDGLGGVLQPISQNGNTVQYDTTPSSVNNSNSSSVNVRSPQAATATVLAPANNSNSSSSSALLTGDLETSLASLAENLSINSRPPVIKEIQWNSPKHGGSKVVATGGWTTANATSSSTISAGYKPMNQSIGANQMPQLGYQQPMQQQQQQQSQQQQFMGMRNIVSNNTSHNTDMMGNQMTSGQLLFH